MEQMEQYSREHKNGQNSGADQEDVQKPQTEPASVRMETETKPGGEKPTSGNCELSLQWA
jgi:hypothetical protein